MKPTTSRGQQKKKTTASPSDPLALMAMQKGSAVRLTKPVKDARDRAILLQQRRRRALAIRSSFHLVGADG